MPVNRVAVLWPDATNYDRFREICEGDIKSPTVEEYHLAVSPDLENKAKHGIHVERVPFDAEELLTFSKTVGRRVDSETRAQFAAMMDHRHATQRD